jgi:hypothetical protein
VKVSEKLLSRLRTEGVVPAGQAVTMQRVNPSRAMRVEGSWSWSASWGGFSPAESAGSQWSMAACLNAASWEVSRNQFGETSVDPRGTDGKYMR